MENEYANFGLPSDPVNQPHQFAAVQRGWFSRNLWWLLPAALLVLIVPCGCCGGILWWVIGSLKSSEPYQMALHRVQTAPKVIEKLGEPIEAASWMPTGNFSYHTINGVASGSASFDFSVSGPKGTARVHAEAVCGNGDGGEMEPEQGMLQNINRKDYFGIPRNPVPFRRGSIGSPVGVLLQGSRVFHVLHRKMNGCPQHGSRAPVSALPLTLPPSASSPSLFGR